MEVGWQVQFFGVTGQRYDAYFKTKEAAHACSDRIAAAILGCTDKQMRSVVIDDDTGTRLVVNAAACAMVYVVEFTEYRRFMKRLKEYSKQIDDEGLSVGFER